MADAGVDFDGEAGVSGNVEILAGGVGGGGVCAVKSDGAVAIGDVHAFCLSSSEVVLTSVDDAECLRSLVFKGDFV